MSQHRDHTPGTEAAGNELRQRAEGALQGHVEATPEGLATLTPEATRTLLHELQVHQVELEMQNESLRATQLELETSRARYFDLYDLAPVGYCTVSVDTGMILEANLTLAGLLGVARGSLTNRWFSRFLIQADQDVFYRLRKQLQSAPTTTQQSCELRMAHNNGQHFWAKLIATLVLGEDDQPQLRLAVTDIQERKQAQNHRAESEARLASVIDSTMDAIITVDGQLRIVLFNPAAVVMFACSQADALGQPLEKFIPAPFRAAHQLQMQDFATTTRGPRPMREGRTVRGLRANGSEVPVEVSISHTKVGDERLFTAVLRDVTARDAAQQALSASLLEKEALLKEVHHRVKNNLQVITSLLRLEAGRAAQPDTRAVLGDMQARIRAMALLHESLYRTGVFASVDLGAYLTQVVTQAFRAHTASASLVRLRLDMTMALVSLDQATPLALMCNELVSNSLKHGFPDARSGDLRVSLHALDGGPQWVLQVSDTGVGLPPDFEARRQGSLGLQLIHDLSRQVKGTLVSGATPEGGALFCVTFTPDKTSA